MISRVATSLFGIVALVSTIAATPPSQPLPSHGMTSVAFGVTDESTDWKEPSRPALTVTRAVPEPPTLYELYVPPPPPPPPIAQFLYYYGPANHFLFGQCTWYVANRRNIPWFGNGWQWPAAAARMGFREGSWPAVGAVMVYGIHVAYVERLNANGSFTISEMNYWANGGGWDRIDWRTLYVQPGMVFIY